MTYSGLAIFIPGEHSVFFKDMIKSFLSLLNASSYFHCGFLVVYFINIDYWTGYILPICVGVIQIFHVYRFKNTNDR